MDSFLSRWCRQGRIARVKRSVFVHLHDEGIVDAEALHDDPVIQERIRLQPMLQWKALNVRNHHKEGKRRTP